MSLEQSRRTASDPAMGSDELYGDSETAGRNRAAELRCQWCSVALTPGSSVCPTCGSTGVPDPQHEDAEREALTAFLLGEDIPVPAKPQALPQDVIAPWRDDALAEPVASARVTRRKMSVEEAESRQKRTLVFAAISALVCIAIGWLAGPLLAGFIESFTGTPVEDTGDLRPMGAMLGMIGGLFIGGVGGIVIWAAR